MRAAWSLFSSVAFRSLAECRSGLPGSAHIDVIVGTSGSGRPSGAQIFCSFSVFAGRIIDREPGEAAYILARRAKVIARAAFADAESNAFCIVGASARHDGCGAGCVVFVSRTRNNILRMVMHIEGEIASGGKGRDGQQGDRSHHGAKDSANSLFHNKTSIHYFHFCPHKSDLQFVCAYFKPSYVLIMEAGSKFHGQVFVVEIEGCGSPFME